MSDLIPVRLVPARPGPEARFARRGVPVTFGLPCPRGWLSDHAQLRLFDPAGVRVPLQTHVAERWSDGSLRWVRLDALVNTAPDGEAVYHVGMDSRRSASDMPGLRVVEHEGRVTVEAGSASFVMAPGGRFPFAEVVVGGVPAVHLDRTGLAIVNEQGLEHEVRIESVRLEERGPIRAAVCLTGVAVSGGAEPLVDIALRLHFWAGLPVVRFELTLRNSRAAGHPDGCWDLGAAGAVYFRDVRFAFAVPPGDPATIECSPETGLPFARRRPPLEIYQDSSGGENWQSANHVNRHRQVPVAFRGYRMEADGETRHGARATPVVRLTAGARHLAIAPEYFWQNFPKAIEATDDGIALALFPRQFGDVHELQGGEQKTHAFVVAFGDDGGAEPLAWARAPLAPVVDREWCVKCGVISPLRVGAAQTRSDYGRLLGAVIEGEHCFERKREAADEYGWRHFGDIYADHESVRSAVPLMSHYNNQYDALAGFAVQYLLDGDVRWRTAMDQLAAHVVDIDIYHTTRDKAAYNNGLFWHTNHYIDCDTATHRTHPRRAGSGGGPSNEHNYTTGLMLHHFITGSPASCDAVVQLAQWVIAMDDGRQTRFWWLDPASTGLASSTSSFDYHGPGRGAGNSINALLDAHRLTNHDVYLRKADDLVRRCIHPRDDPDDRRLLDAERRWSYTVFLQVLGKYLEHREERGLIGVEYDYARESLRTYARWMRDHERPYLERPEQLEFPTETWPAQDIRKAAVFEFAAQYEQGPLRGELLDRASFFFDYAVSTLQKMPTWCLTRPLVLLMAYSFQRPALGQGDARSQDRPGLRSDVEFGRAVTFVPYKRRVLRRAAGLAVCGTAVATVLWILLTR